MHLRTALNDYSQQIGKNLFLSRDNFTLFKLNEGLWKEHPELYDILSIFAWSKQGKDIVHPFEWRESNDPKSDMIEIRPIHNLSLEKYLEFATSIDKYTEWMRSYQNTHCWWCMPSWISLVAHSISKRYICDRREKIPRAMRPRFIDTDFQEHPFEYVYKAVQKKFFSDCYPGLVVTRYQEIIEDLFKNAHTVQDAEKAIRQAINSAVSEHSADTLEQTEPATNSVREAWKKPPPRHETFSLEQFIKPCKRGSKRLQ